MKPTHGGKQRARRIPLSYNRRPDKWVRLKLIGAAIAVLAFVAWCANALFLPEFGAGRFSPGHVAGVHATWNDKCSTCHEPFRSVRDGAVEVAALGLQAASNDRCVSCHLGAEHHASEKKIPEVESCSSCHLDHAGALADITRPSNAMCTVCHADLDSNTMAGAPTLSPPVANEITGFWKDGEHPGFRSLDGDPGNVKFNHDLHLKLGLTVRFREEQLSQSDRARFRNQGRLADAGSDGDDEDSGLVQLNCGSCHQVDSSAQFLGIEALARQEAAGRGGVPVGSASGSSMGPRSGNGDFMGPIRFEDHCQACHPLSFEVGRPDRIVRHAASADEMRGYLSEVFRGELDRGVPGETDSVTLGIGLLESLDGTVRQGPTPDEPQKWIAAKVRDAERHLRNVCFQCHEMGDPITDSSGELRLLSDVAPSTIRAVWLRHAKFGHTAHRAIGCRECHESAYSDSPRPSAVHTDVIMPGREICLKCHRPVAQSDGMSWGGARDDCVECHRYHGGDYPMHGIGAVLRGAGGEHSLREFLDGTAPSSD